MSANMMIFSFGFLLGGLAVLFLLGLISLVKDTTKVPGQQATAEKPLHRDPKNSPRENQEILVGNFLLVKVMPGKKEQVASRGQGSLCAPSHLPVTKH